MPIVSEPLNTDSPEDPVNRKKLPAKSRSPATNGESSKSSGSATEPSIMDLIQSGVYPISLLPTTNTTPKPRVLHKFDPKITVQARLTRLANEKGSTRLSIKTPTTLEQFPIHACLVIHSTGFATEIIKHSIKLIVHTLRVGDSLSVVISGMKKVPTKQLCINLESKGKFLKSLEKLKLNYSKINLEQAIETAMEICSVNMVDEVRKFQFIHILSGMLP